MPLQPFMADQVTLSQPEGADYAHYINTDPRIFRPSYGPALVSREPSFLACLLACCSLLYFFWLWQTYMEWLKKFGNLGADIQARSGTYIELFFLGRQRPASWRQTSDQTNVMVYQKNDLNEIHIPWIRLIWSKWVLSQLSCLFQNWPLSRHWLICLIRFCP